MSDDADECRRLLGRGDKTLGQTLLKSIQTNNLPVFRTLLLDFMPDLNQEVDIGEGRSSSFVLQAMIAEFRRFI